MTGSQDCVERAHLCPRSQQGWFETNNMGQYNRNLLLSGNSVIDDVSNGIAFRSDIHTLFDCCKFVIVPKESRWVAHFCDLTNTAGALYHNTPLEVAFNVFPGLLLVRFAWTVFTFAKRFMECGADQYVRLPICALAGEGKGTGRGEAQGAQTERESQEAKDGRGGKCTGASPERKQAAASLQPFSAVSPGCLRCRSTFRCLAQYARAHHIHPIRNEAT